MRFRKRHKQTYFYKYVSSKTAELILENGSFLCRCPLEFNDPFDVQIGMHFDFDIRNLNDIFFQRLVLLVEADDQPAFDNENDFSKFVLLIRERLKTDGFPKEKIRKEIQPHISKMGEFFESNRASFVQERMNFVKG